MCVIAVDYDGTITADFLSAKKALTYLRKQGHTIVIWSSRNNKQQHGQYQEDVFLDMLETLQKYQIPYDIVDNGSYGKFHAQVYIDDKALRYEKNWEWILQQIY